MQVTVNMKKLIIIHWLVEISLLQYVLFFLTFFFQCHKLHLIIQTV